MFALAAWSAYIRLSRIMPSMTVSLGVLSLGLAAHFNNFLRSAIEHAILLDLILLL